MNFSVLGGSHVDNEKASSPLTLPAQLAIVCRLLCKRAEYAQAFRLADLMPNMPVQQAAEQALCLRQQGQLIARTLAPCASS